MVKAIGAFCISFLLAFVLMSFLPLNGEEEIYENMIRLHVIANSDSAEDQSLKLKVRDAILDSVEGMELNSMDEARNEMEKSIERLEKCANEVILAEGYDYPVNIVLGKENYPERIYEGFTLPEGTYISLQVKIGSAGGKNWWCVLFPPLCTTSAMEREESFIAAGFTGEQYETITKPEKKSYKIKFKIVEIIKNLFD